MDFFMDTENIKIILEQKNLILKDIYNITKRIEVNIKSEDADIIALIDKRRQLLERMLKCDPAIKNVVQREENPFSDDEKQRLEKIIANDAQDLDLTCQEKEIYDKASENSALIKRITTLNSTVERMLKNEYEKTKIELSKIKPAQNGENMFR